MAATCAPGAVRQRQVLVIGLFARSKLDPAPVQVCPIRNFGPGRPRRGLARVGPRLLQRIDRSRQAWMLLLAVDLRPRLSRFFDQLAGSWLSPKSLFPREVD